MINIVYMNCQLGNWGDIVAKYIAEHYSKQEAKWVSARESTGSFIRYGVTGSILETISNDNTVVWGLGFISNGSVLKSNPKILAVRGPLTRDKLIAQGKSCPEVYGDPALLISKYYKPDIKKKYKVGIIPHYVDFNNKWLDKFKDNPDIKIIDIQNRASKKESYKFIDEVLECDVILSSSLHGIIIGDSYGIPSYWLEFSDKVIGSGFKFRDYFMSVNRNERKPIEIKENTRLKDILSNIEEYKIDIDLDLLESVCPFKK